METERKCRTCGETKEIDDFPRNKSKRGGRDTSCRDCVYKRNRAYRAKNREKVNAQKREHYRRAVEQNANAEPATGTRVCSQCQQDLPITDFVKHRAKAGGYSSRCKPCDRLYFHESRRNVRIEALRTYGHKAPRCVCCGSDVPAEMFLNLKGGGGRRFRREREIPRLVTWLAERGFPPGFQTVCPNCCQSISAHGVCAHDDSAIGTIAAATTYDQLKYRRHRFELLTAYCNSPTGKPACEICGEDRIAFLNLDFVDGDGAERLRRHGFKTLKQYHKMLEREGYPEKDKHRVLCASHNQALTGYLPDSWDEVMAELNTESATV